MKALLFATLASMSAGLVMTSCESTPGASKTSAYPAVAKAGSAAPDGRKIYYGRCTSCHAADPVGDYTRSEWHGIMAEMAPKAKLTGAERSAVTAYVMAHAADS